MAVSAILFGLLPIMWSPSTQAGADVMKRIATPMIGGVITSAFLNLLIYPVIYIIWKKRDLTEQEEEEALFLPPALVVSRENRQRLFKWIAVIIGLVAIFYAGQFAWHKLRPTQISGAPFLTQNVNDLTVNFVAREGALRQGNNEVLIEFRDGKGQLVDVGKLLDNRYFSEVLAQWRLLPSWSLLLLGVVLSLLELALALWLFSGWRLAQAALVSVLFHLGYTGGTAITLLRGISLPDCGCFGILFAHPLDWPMAVE